MTFLDEAVSREQLALWLQHELVPGGAYHTAGAVRVAGAIDTNALEAALAALIARYPLLRTTFPARDGRPVQRVAATAAIAIETVEAADWTEAATHAWLDTAAQRPFDLGLGPLWRVCVARRRDHDVLLVCMHAIIADARSLTVLAGELGRFYREGAQCTLGPIVAYRDHVQRQEQLLASARGEQLAQFWQTRLAGELPVLELPADRSRPPIPSYAGGSHVMLGDRRDDVTVLAAFAVLLHRLTGLDDLVIGYAPPRSDASVGCFTSYVPIRVDVSGQPSFEQLVGRVGDTVREALAHAEFPFHAITERIQPHRDASRSPIFQAAFESGIEPGLAAFAPDAAAIDLAATGSPFDLTLAATARGLAFRYAADLFDASTIARMAGNFERVIDGGLAAPARPVAELALLAPPERERLIHELNVTACDNAHGRLVHEIFAEQAARLPDAIAVIVDRSRVSYADLDRSANRLAHRLRELGIGPDRPVGIFVERSLEMVVAILGVLKAGGAYVPLDPGYPVDRLGFMIRDSAVTVIVAQTHLLDRLRALAPDVTTLDAAEFERGPGGDVAPARVATPDDLAYIIYTSGSTGNPKGVMISHRACVNFIAWLIRTYEIKPGDRGLYYRSPSFDVSVWELFGILLAGATLVLAKTGEPAHLLDMIVEHQVTSATFVPSLLDLLLGEPRFRACDSLRSVTCGGETLTPALLQRFHTHKRGELYNGYGPTETTVASTMWRCVPGAERVPIGTPIDNTQCYVLDKHRRLVPFGVPGELYIAGVGLARGYLHRAALSASSFVADPFSETPGARMYKTGDLARWLPDGNLEFLGRVDDQVKIRGFRVELGEIETALAQHPAVRDVAVLARDDGPGGKRLVAYTVAHATAPATSELRAYLKSRLPDYMVPSAFVALDAFPLTPNGKINRKALPAPSSGRDAARDGYVAPRTADESALAAIWTQVLRIEQIGVHDDFFELGGHSLLATQVLSRVREMFHVEVALRSMFEQPTVAKLAELLGAAPAQAAAPSFERVPRTGELELSFAQQRLWFFDRLNPGSSFYNTSTPLRLRGPLDAELLARALERIVERHEALRTTFTESDGRAIQVIAPSLAQELPIIAVASEAEAHRRAVDDARAPFDLERGPLIRTTLLRLAPDEHWLLVTIHHIVADGWSFGVLTRELAEVYGALRAGRQPNLPPLAIQYADFAAWQRAWMSDAVLAKQLDYWTQQLRGATSVLELPADRPRPPAQSYAGARSTFDVPPALTRALEAASRDRSATLFMTLLAAFQTLLHRLSGQDDIVVGTPVANRNRAETEGLIGFFVNTLAIRTDCSGNPTFRELVGRVRDVALGSFAHQDLPFERLVEELRPERSLGHSPIFQVMFVLQNAPDAVDIPGLEQSVIDIDAGTAKFDLTLVMEERAGGMFGAFEYSTDLFDAATIARFIDQFSRLLAAVVADPDRKIAALPLLSPAERQLVAGKWAGTARPVAERRSLHALVEAQVQRSPDAIAATHDGAALTYRELDARATSLAGELAARGAGPERIVGLLLERSLDTVVAQLAVLKTGAAFLPIDPKLPADRMQFMLDDAKANVVVVHDRTKLVAARLGDVACIPADASRASAGFRAVTPGELAYVIYTSGSTGRPKGVMVQHEAIVNHVLAWIADLSITAADRHTLVASPAFDALQMELWPLLVAGGRVDVVDDDVRSTPERMWRFYAERAITLSWLPAPLAELLLDAAPARLDALAMRTLYCGGDRLRRSPPAHARFTFLNTYGPTETAVTVTAGVVVPGDTLPSIGHPCSNVTAYVLDANLEPVPRGVAGELCIGGANVARGYLDRPALTAERFVPDPFAPWPGARLYRTGDRVRHRPDGSIEFMGRLDQQVKIRGFRIELAEIETLLAQHPRVTDAIVIAREDIPGDKQLVAYVVGAKLVAAELASFLATTLPEYMVPSAFVVLAALPLTANGKVDRKALPAPARSSGVEHVAPRTPVEIAIADIFASVLRLPAVGVHDGFFQLGGHSLLATQVVARVRTALGVDLPLRALFEASTVAALAELVEGASAADPAGAMRAVPRDRPLELSFAQERLWFLEQLDPGRATYNVVDALELRGPLDVDALERHVRALVARHESLRTTFETHDGKPVQIVAPSHSFSLARVEVDRAEARERLIAEARQPFDLDRGPLVRATVLRLGPDEHWLVIAMHHIVTDGWSMATFWRELAAIARGETLPPIALHYADFAAWQRAWLTGDVLAEQLAYWKQQLRGAPSLLELPTDRPRPAVMTYAGALRSFELPAPLAAALRELGTGASATLFMTLLAAFQTLLHRYTGQDDIVVGAPAANRNRAETEAMIGFFVNTLVLRTDLSGDPSFRDLLARVREVALAGYTHQDLPFDQLVIELQPERSLGHTPLFQVMFALQEAAAGPGLAGIDHRVLDIDSGTAKFDLMLTMEEHAGGLRGTFEYRTDLFDADTIARIVDQFSRLLAAIVADPQQRISTLPLLGPDERQVVAGTWAGTARPVAERRSLHALVEAQVQRSPDAIAATHDGAALTYRELDARATGLANELAARGAGPERIVGLLLERSLDTVVAQLAVLKTGAAFLPIDPKTPSERMRFMLDDAKASVVVVHDRTQRVAAELGTIACVPADASRASATLAAATSANLAYVIYTSGSTGRPKGVMVHHEAIVNHVLAWITELAITAADRHTLVASPAFDALQMELWPMLVAGGRVDIVDDDVRGTPERMWQFYAERAITLSWLPAPLAELLLDAAPARLDTLAMRTLYCGGDRLRRSPPGHARFTFLNTYGPTETAVTVTAGVVVPGDTLPSIGHPCSNVTAYVLDANLEPVPRGVAGELCIGGANVARGYLDRPALTAERFVPDPFAPWPGARLYRTGDRVRHLADGSIEFMGRLDQQVKIRGFRIELAEIETVLAQHPRVTDAVVIAREDIPGDKQLVAYVVGADLVASELASYLATSLNDYMVPSAFVVLDTLPLTANGKIDRKALPAPMRGSGSEHVAPRTPVEATLADIFASVLQLPSVGVHDGFFQVGGHSLLATRVIARVRQAFEIDVPLRTLFEAPTVAALATRLGDGGPRSRAPIAAIPRTGELPLSFAEQRLWFLDRLDPGSPLYNVAGAFRLTGALDAAALERSFAELIARHEILRTSFPTRDDRAVRTIAPAAPLALARVDLSAMPAAAREAELRRLAALEARLPFDLTTAPLLRVTLLRESPTQHVIVLVLHHIVVDEWSLGVLWRELAQIYAALRAGARPELPHQPIEYADFATWQRDWLVGKELGDQLAYWKQRLAGMPALLELPTDRPRPAVQSDRGAMQAFELPQATATALHALGRAQSTTLFMTLLAAFQTLLHRYTGQTDIAVGSPIANRDRAELQELVGFFLNTLVFRTDTSGDPTFRELLARVREAALGAYAHQDVPLDKLVEELQPERSLAHSPLFQVMFVLQHATAGLELAGLTATPIELDTSTAKFDLTLFVTDDGAGNLHGAIEYNTDLFDAATVTRMIGHFERLLAGIAADPDTQISALPLLTEPEREQLLVTWNDTDRPDYGDDTCIHELFEAQVERTPGAIAMVAGGRSFTYHELDERANRLAQHLRACGAGPDTRVGIFLERSAELVIAMFAALKAGAAYVPLDPTYPRDRLAFIQEDARPTVLVTQRSLGGLLPDLGIRTVLVDNDAATIARAPATRLPRSAKRTDLSHVIYTSGSTGRPKGVAIEHGVMVNYIRFSRDLHPAAEHRACLFATSVCFDMSLFELFVPLAWGGRVHVVDDLFSLPTVPPDAGLTFLNAVPSVLAAYLRAGTLPTTLEAVSCAGEPLSNALVKQLYAAGVKRVYDFYGPTETFIATWSLRSGEGQAVIGKPISNSKVYLLDPRGALVPAGLRGEVFVSGDGLARGYLDRPELTAERFVANPFGPGRMYKTGDIARWLPDGTLAYMGRADHQVKIRGFRVEPGEIEVLLGKHPAVREAAVIAREDTPGDKRLVAYVVGRETAPQTADLRAYLKDRVPDYMVPSAFVVMAALPQTPNGKIDRKALPAPEGGRTAVDRAYVAPRTPIEARLAAIWAEVLGVPQVGIHDNFFELGGHSLLATQVMSRVREAFRVELPLRSLFEDATVAELGETVAAATPAVTTRIAPANRDRDLELSFAQQRLWFLEHLEPGSPQYHLGQAVRLRGPLDVAALERSLGAIVQRHEALRTSFPTRDGRGVQLVAPELAVPLVLVDLTTIATDAREAEARRLVQVESRRGFDLARGPLLRATLLRLGPEEHWFVLALHHIVFDGWSFAVFERELAACYAAFTRGAEPALPPLSIHYADFAAWQRQWLSGAVLDEQLDYWRHQLRGAPSLLELPTDRTRPPVQTFKGAAFHFEVPVSLAAAVRGLCRDEAVTPFMTLLAAFQTLLHRYSGQDDILVGTPVANRNRKDTEPLIGFFVNTLVLRGDLAGNPTFRELLRRVRETALSAYAHQDIPFEKLVAELQPERSLSYAPLFQVSFLLQNASEDAALQGLAREVIAVEHATSKFDLTLVLEDSADGLRGTFEYSTELFDAATMARMASHFQRLLAAVVADPACPIDELPLLDATERVQLVGEWNATARSPQHDRRIHEQFERQAAAAPDRIALVFEGQSLSYGELDARANQLAHHLQTLDVGPETRVGVVMERSLEMIVALLAILKAGAAYVPLDPEYPPDRLEYMIGDAQLRVLLIQDRFRALVPTTAIGVAIDSEWPAIARQSVANLGVVVRPDNLIYVIYTSGSTGRPKGALNTHAGAENHLRWLTERFGFGPDERILHKTSFSFDASVWDMFLPLVCGARLVIAKPGGHQDPNYMAAMIRSEGITTIHFVPSMLAAFLDTADVESCTSLRRIAVGGEALPLGTVQRFHRRLRASLHNMYGPTEASVFSSSWECSPDEPAIAPIGRPIANMRMYVLDRNLEPTPCNVAGEIFIAGVGLARGYLERPALTAERFIPDPFSIEPGGRLYRTGDRGRVRPDGVIEFMGRLDHQVKIRGFRIELSEIETVLAQHPRVTDVIVVAREDVPGDKQLVAYVVGTELGAAGLADHLRTSLPEYMVPSAFVVLDALPLTPNGKVDRKALPAPQRSSGVEHVAPRTRTELELAQCFAELLRMPSVGARDNFFALGGHSLLAVQLISAIAARLHVTLPVSALFRAPTVEALAREIDDQPAVTSQLVPLRRDGTRAPVVFVHPVGGTVFCYQDLVAHLDHPCFGLEAKGIASDDAPAESVAAMAAAYTQILVAELGPSPIHVVGWSFGGLVALELARGLAAAGREVLTTTLIDTFSPTAFPSASLDPIVVLAAFASDMGLVIEDAELQALEAQAALDHVAELARSAGILPAHLGASYLARRVRVFVANLRASKQHVPHAPANRVALIRAADRRVGNGVDPAEGWRAVLPSLTVLEAPGTHHSMVAPPNVDELARILAGVIA